MTSTGYRREDVIEAAGRLFAEHGYHATSMRDLGRAVGLHGSSLYAHITSKEDLLVEVVERGARLFEASARHAVAAGETGEERLRRLIAGHIDVVLDHREVVRTYLSEARNLDQRRRRQVVGARDRYEAVFRRVIEEARQEGSVRPDLDPKLTGIYLLSMLNALDRWFRDGGPMSRTDVADSMMRLLATPASDE